MTSVANVPAGVDDARLLGVDFRSEQYWNTFFEKSEKPFEWYGGNTELKEILETLFNRNGQSPEDVRRVLNVGCGNSTALEVLAANCPNAEVIDNIDYSQVAIDQLKTCYAEKHRAFKFSRVDVSNRGLETLYPPGSVDLVLDKGFLDAYLSVDDTADSTKIATLVGDYLQSVATLLKPDTGRLIIISLCQDYVLKGIVRHLMKAYPTVTWRCDLIPFTVRTKSDDSGQGGVNRLEPYALALSYEKPEDKPALRPLDILPLRNDPLRPQLEAVASTFAGKFGIAPLLAMIPAVRRQRRVHAITTRTTPGERRTIEYNIQKPGGKTVTYEVGIYDAKTNASQTRMKTYMNKIQNVPKTAAVLVPKGSEYESLFSSSSGNQQMAEQLNVERLLTVINLSPSSVETPDLNQLSQATNEDIGALLKQLSTFGGSSKTNIAQIPIVTVPPMEWGPDTMILFEDEDCLVLEREGGSIRSLVFKSMPRLVQSEVLCDKDSKAFEHLKLQSVYQGIQLLSSILPVYNRACDTAACSSPSVAIIGAGAGSLGMAASLLWTLYRRASATEKTLTLTEIELDSRMIDFGTRFFGVDLINDERVKHTVVCSEGIQWTTLAESSSLDVLIVDANGHDLRDPIASPPKAFRDHQFLDEALRVLRPGGLLSVNFVSRDGPSANTFARTLQTCGFTTDITSISNDHEVNRVVLAYKPTCDAICSPSAVEFTGEVDKSQKLLRPVLDDKTASQLDVNWFHAARETIDDAAFDIL